MAPPSLVIFDMDGTLTLPVLDFDQIRRDIGIASGPILEALERMTLEDRRRAEAVLERHEADAALRSELQPGAAHALLILRRAGVPLALMTRNSAESVRHFQSRHHLSFDRVWTREDGPMKPSPEPVFTLCRHFNASPESTWVVGDFHFDLVCANRAGAISVLLWNLPEPLPTWSSEAAHVIGELSQLLTLMGMTAQ